MSRARYESKDLRTRKYEVEDLWYEEEKERLGEVGDDGDAGEGHAGKVAERIAWKGS